MIKDRFTSASVKWPGANGLPDAECGDSAIKKKDTFPDTGMSIHAIIND
ncbi:MAG: hypothetical protein WCJ93_02370 [Methanomicrobiales archaeon]